MLWHEIDFQGVPFPCVKLHSCITLKPLASVTTQHEIDLFCSLKGQILTYTLKVRVFSLANEDQETLCQLMPFLLTKAASLRVHAQPPTHTVIRIIYRWWTNETVAV